MTYESKQASVSFDPSKTKIEQLHAAITKAGLESKLKP